MAALASSNPRAATLSLGFLSFYFAGYQFYNRILSPSRCCSVAVEELAWPYPLYQVSCSRSTGLTVFFYMLQTLIDHLLVGLLWPEFLYQVLPRTSGFYRESLTITQLLNIYLKQIYR